MAENQLSFEDPEIVKLFNSSFGKVDNSMFHAVVPFRFGFDNGGASDVWAFKNHTNGIMYVTGNLIGEKQKPSDAGNYELAVFHKVEEDWGHNFISKLSYYTLDTSLNSGETMGIGNFSKGDIIAVLFDCYKTFDYKGKKLGVMVCIGITKKELEFKEKHGGAELIKRLKTVGIYPFTIFKRKSVI